MTGQPGAGDAPQDVRDLAAQRAAARKARDFAAADELRDQIRELGWQVTDSPAGPQLAPAADQDLAGAGRRIATVALLVQGWPADLRECVAALLAHMPPGVVISGLDVGNADGAGDVLHELALANPERVTELRAHPSPGWGAARNALLRADPGPVHVLMETSTIVTGDAISPLLTALAADGVVAAGWRGADPDPDLLSFHDAGPGPVTALLGYLWRCGPTPLPRSADSHPGRVFTGTRTSNSRCALAVRGRWWCHQVRFRCASPGTGGTTTPSPRCGMPNPGGTTVACSSSCGPARSRTILRSGRPNDRALGDRSRLNPWPPVS